jgi:CheY-like chemotaxis protein
MLQRVFVRVVGFSAAERHALNTIFRLSQDRQSAREWSYEPWATDSPAAPRLALIDGASPDASEALSEVEALGGIGIIWVGSISRAKAWRAFQRPMSWPLVLSCMDEYFTPSGDRVDLDFGQDTWPGVLESASAPMFPEHSVRRVLIADTDNDARLNLRTKLAFYGITHIDEVANVLEAKDHLAPERLQRMGYDLVIVDLDLPGGDPWSVMAAAASARLKLLIQHRMSFSSRMSARLNGCVAMGKPLDPSRLNDILNKMMN